MDLSPVTIVGIVALWYVIIPRMVWKELEPQAAWQMEPFDPGLHGTGAQASAFLANSVGSLTARGFRQVGDLVHRGQITNTRVIILTHPDDHLVATVVVLATERVSNIAMVEFTAELVSGTVFDVNNSPTVSTFAKTPDHVTYRLPSVRDPARLHEIARTLLRRDFGSAAVRQRDVGDPAAFLKEATDREYRRQVGTGYFRFNEGTGRYSVTLKGAYLMAWKLMFPFKAIRAALQSRKGRSVLRGLGMDG